MYIFFDPKKKECTYLIKNVRIKKYFKANKLTCLNLIYYYYHYCIKSSCYCFYCYSYCLKNFNMFIDLFSGSLLIVFKMVNF